MAKCKECSKPIKAWEALGGACGNCRNSAYLKNKPRLKQNLNEAERELAQQEIGSMLVTTAHTLQGIEVTKYLGVISAECAYGMNMFKDMFARSVDRSCYRVSLG